MAGLPVFLKLEDKKVAVIGGGSVASRKIGSLAGTGAGIVVISPKIGAKLEEMVDAGMLKWRQKNYEYGDLKGFWLVIAATSENRVNYRVYEEAKEVTQLYNIADRPDLSSFYTTAQVKQGDLQIGISTGGKAPALSAEIRRELTDRFGDSFKEYLEFTGEVREWLLENEEPEIRREVLREMASPEILDGLMAGNLEEVFERLEKTIPERFYNERAL